MFTASSILPLGDGIQAACYDETSHLLYFCDNDDLYCLNTSVINNDSPNVIQVGSIPLDNALLSWMWHSANQVFLLCKYSNSSVLYTLTVEARKIAEFSLGNITFYTEPDLSLAGKHLLYSIYPPKNMAIVNDKGDVDTHSCPQIYGLSTLSPTLTIGLGKDGAVYTLNSKTFKLDRLPVDYSSILRSITAIIIVDDDGWLVSGPGLDSKTYVFASLVPGEWKIRVLLEEPIDKHFSRETIIGIQQVEDACGNSLCNIAKLLHTKNPDEIFVALGGSCFDSDADMGASRVGIFNRKKRSLVSAPLDDLLQTRQCFKMIDNTFFLRCEDQGYIVRI